MHFQLPLVLAAALAACQGSASSPGCSEHSHPEVTATSTAVEDPETPVPDTSLLQHRLQLQPPSVFPDVPEAARAWALWQQVPDGEADPSKLVNSTQLPIPGSLFPGQAEILHKLGPAHGYGFSAPSISEDNTSCMFGEVNLTPYSSWYLQYVAHPQVVPFVVPKGQPGRTDVSVIIAPGGGAVFLDWEIEGTDLARSLNTMGISAFVLAYRVPLQVWGVGARFMDAQRALGIVRHHAAALGLNTSRVGMLGASHGGTILAYTSYATKRLYERRDAADDWNQKPDFWLMIYPQLFLDELRKVAAGPHTADGVEMNGLGSTPPAFFAIGANDRCCPVEDVYEFHELVKLQSNAPVEINVYDGVGHYWGTCFRNGREAMMHEACLWLLRARHFIMWNVEHKVPSEIEDVFLESIKFVNPLLVRNASA